MILNYSYILVNIGFNVTNQVQFRDILIFDFTTGLYPLSAVQINMDSHFEETCPTSLNSDSKLKSKLDIKHQLVTGVF